MVTLRDYQEDILSKVKSSQGNPLVQLDTGAGKTPIIAHLAAQAERCIVVAHRNELAIQSSEKLAALDVEHDTISTDHTRKRAILRHRRNGHNRVISRGNKTHLVASLLSLISLLDNDPAALDTSENWLIIIDEAHHVQPDNIWGSLKTRFANAKIVGFTGTPARYDGGPLHVDCGGLFTDLIQADSLKIESDKVLTERGFLSGFDAIYPAQALPSLREDGQMAIAGDPVKTYKNRASGRRAIAICASVLNAKEQVENFRSSGISSAYIAYDLGAATVSNTLDRFSNGEIEVLFSVDMISEGFDMPEADVLIILSRTGSFVRFRQWVGRVRRPKHDGRKSLIIDHVGMLFEHGMPDDPVIWDIKHPPKRATRLQHAPCENCGCFYKILFRNCPDCGAENPMFSRGGGVGGFHLRLRQLLDVGLIERIQQQVRSEQLAEELRTRLFIPAEIASWSSGDAISKSVYRIATWAIDELKNAGNPIVDINAFIADKKTKSIGWWVNRFRMTDLKQPSGINKIEKAFLEWQKSN